jgi:metal-dependent amidase/aminoacylase/carboxypeptidase family protein
MYLEHAPGTMFRLGVGLTDKPNYPLHHPQFEVNEAAIVTGAVTLGLCRLPILETASRFTLIVWDVWVVS